MYTCVHTYIYIYIYIHMCICICKCAFVYVCKRVCQMHCSKDFQATMFVSFCMLRLGNAMRERLGKTQKLEARANS